MNEKEKALFWFAGVYGIALLSIGGFIKYKLAKLDWENALKMAEKVKEASAK